MNPARPWTADEIRILVEAFCAGGKLHAAEVLGRDPQAVQSKFSRVKTDTTVPYAIRKKAREAKSRRWEGKGATA